MIEPITKEELKTWRGDRTQSEAADELGIPYDSYCSYERGKRRIPSSMRITILGATVKKRRAKCAT